MSSPTQTCTVCGTVEVVKHDGRGSLAAAVLEARAAIEKAVAQPYVEAIRAMFDQSGCDCDSAWIAERGMDGEWPAPYHASDCPVYERWEPFEGRFRALIEDRPGGGE